MPKKDSDLAERLIAGSILYTEAHAELVAIARNQHGHRRVRHVLEAAAEGDPRYKATKDYAWGRTAHKLPPLTTMVMMLTSLIAAEAGREH